MRPPRACSRRRASSHSTVPITEKEASDPAIAGAFQALKAGQKPAGRQAEFESRWDAAVVKNYTEARTLAERR